MAEAKNLIKIHGQLGSSSSQTFFLTWYTENGLKGQGHDVWPSDFDRMWLRDVPNLAIPDIC